MKTALKISIVAYVFSESATLKPLNHRIRDVMGIIWRRIRRVLQTIENLRKLLLEIRYRWPPKSSSASSNAIWARRRLWQTGVARAKIDADLQDGPNEIRGMLAKIEEKYRVVPLHRKKKKVISQSPKMSK